MRRGLLPIALVVALSGCHFSREVVNAHVRDVDTAWIEPGKTTREDVVARIGLPPTIKHMGGVKKDSFRWVMVDTNSRGCQVGYVLTPTFEKAIEHYAEDILVRFDEKGVVTLVSRTRSDGDTVKVVEYREATP